MHEPRLERLERYRKERDEYRARAMTAEAERDLLQSEAKWPNPGDVDEIKTTDGHLLQRFRYGWIAFAGTAQNALCGQYGGRVVTDLETKRAAIFATPREALEAARQAARGERAVVDPIQARYPKEEG